MGASSIGKRMISWHDQVSIHGPIQSIVFFICDDCGEAYMSPMYYTFEPSDCHVDDDDGPHKGCTGNLCPSCAGPDIDPYDLHDPRRPSA